MSIKKRDVKEIIIHGETWCPNCLQWYRDDKFETINEDKNEMLYCSICEIALGSLKEKQEKVLSAKEKFELGLKKQQEEMKKRIELEKENKGISKNTNTTKKVLKRPKKVKEVKPKVAKVSKLGYSKGWSSDPKLVLEYHRDWNAKNQDKIKEYRRKTRENPILVQKRKIYEANRPNKEERLEFNRKKREEYMKNPIFVKKEFLRGQLRRKNLSEDKREKIQKEFEEVNLAWKNREDK